MATLRFAESLTLFISGKGTGSGEVRGKMVFNRKDYGMKKAFRSSRLPTCRRKFSPHWKTCRRASLGPKLIARTDKG
jgi:hypothetical protein